MPFSPKKHSTLRGWPPGVTRIPYGPGASISDRVWGSSQPRRSQVASLAFPGYISVFQPDQGPGALSSLLQPAQGPGALTSCPASPGMVPYLQGLSETVFRWNHVLSRARKPTDCLGLFRTIPATPGSREGLGASPGCTGNSLQVPRTLDPWEGLPWTLCDSILHRTLLGHLFNLFCENVFISWKVPTGSVAILDFKMEVSLHGIGSSNPNLIVHGTGQYTIFPKDFNGNQQILKKKNFVLVVWFFHGYAFNT